MATLLIWIIFTHLFIFTFREVRNRTWIYIKCNAFIRHISLYLKLHFLFFAQFKLIPGKMLSPFKWGCVERGPWCASFWQWCLTFQFNPNSQNPKQWSPLHQQLWEAQSPSPRKEQTRLLTLWALESTHPNLPVHCLLTSTIACQQIRLIKVIHRHTLEKSNKGV